MRFRPLPLTALLLTSLLAACGTPPAPLPPAVVQPARVPPLPQAARQPPIPPICSPTCLENWSKRVENLRRKLDGAETPDLPASAPTMP